MNYRAERASLENFHIKKLIFLSIFCWYFRNVSTIMTYLPGHMYRQFFKCTDKTPKRHYGGGGQWGNCPPPPPPPPASLWDGDIHKVLGVYFFCRVNNFLIPFISRHTTGRMSQNAVVEWKFFLDIRSAFYLHLSALQIFGPILVAGPNVFVMLKTFEVRAKLIERHEVYSNCILNVARRNSINILIVAGRTETASYFKSWNVPSSFFPTTFELHQS